MTKLNAENHFKEDDELLILLLKEHGEEPSLNLTAKTLSKFLALRAERKVSFKPLRVPLYLMSLIGLLLILPLFMPVTVGGADPGFMSDLLYYPAGPIVKYVAACWLLFYRTGDFNTNDFNI